MMSSLRFLQLLENFVHLLAPLVAPTQAERRRAVQEPLENVQHHGDVQAPESLVALQLVCDR